MISSIGSNSSSLYEYLMQLRASGSSTSSTSSTSTTDDLFSKIDTSGDGTVSEDEFNTFRSEMEAQFKNSVMTSKYDSTGAATSTDDLFSKVDSDGDGTVSEDEFGMFRSAMESHGAPPPPPPPDSSASSSSSSSIDDLFGKIDTDGDGTVSEDEFGTFLAGMEAAIENVLLQGQDSTSIDSDTSVGSTAEAASSATSVSTAATDSTSDQTDGASLFASLIMEAITKYMTFSQPQQGSTSTGQISVAA